MNKIHLSMSLRKANEKIGEQKLKIAELEKEQSIRDLEQQAKGRLDGVSYALNMYCSTMSPKKFPAIGDYYASQLKAKALKE